MTIRVIVVDDQALIRGGFSMVLNHQVDLEVVSEAADGLEAIEQAKQHKPDIVLMDIRMPKLDGLKATKQLLDDADWPVKVLILTTFSSDEYVYEALRAGASGFVLKDIPPEDLVSAVRTISKGGALLAPVVTKRLIGEFTKQLKVNTEFAARLEALTARERQVLAAIARGLSNSDIADELIIGTTTVKTHVSSLLSKLGLRDRVQAVVFAYESGLIQAGDQSYSDS